jgi:DNA-binding transcriptional regulator YiaG
MVSSEHHPPGRCAPTARSTAASLSRTAGTDRLPHEAFRRTRSLSAQLGAYRPGSSVLGSVRKKTNISGKELRYLRTEMDMTQAQLALVVHREPPTVSRWERGEENIDSDAEALIAFVRRRVFNMGLCHPVTALCSLLDRQPY